MKTMLAALIGALALVALGPADAFDVQQYRLVDLSHAYDSQTLYWPSRPPMKFELERKVALLGVDTASIDYGRSQYFDVHRIAAARGPAVWRISPISISCRKRDSS